MTMVTLETNYGNITLKLYEDKAPITVENFLKYVDDGFYNGTIFHRVIPNFMIQGGGMDVNMQEKENNPPIKNEANNGLSNKRGTIAMARTMVVDSATSQFFINTNNNTFLDHGGRDFGYAVFGEVAEGMDTIDKISSTKTGFSGMHQDVPLEPIIIQKAYKNSEKE